MGDVRVVVPFEDGRSFATGSTDGTARLWHGDDDSDPVVFEGPRGPVYTVALSPDRSLVATGDRNGSVRVFDRASDIAQRQSTTLYIHGEDGRIAERIPFGADGKGDKGGKDKSK